MGMRRITPTDERGFALIELLVVILIIGILSAVALAAFLSQRTKAQDADAKSDVRAAAQAMETYSINNDGSYVAATPAALRNIEPTLINANNLAVLGTPTTSTFQVRVNSDSGTTYTIARGAGGTITRTCSNPGSGSCKSADSNGNMW
jgi:type IV pilus assembly protein PilA